jgi:hypothetical protein
MSELFSKRHGYHQPHEIEITVRQDASYELRGVVIQLAYGCGFRPKGLRALVCRVLKKRPDERNWSEYPNIDGEIHQLIDNCEWYRVYDIIESIAQHIGEAETEKFENELNDYFLENGVGWKLVKGKIEARGSESFEETIRSAELQLTTRGCSTARNEMHEALHDLSRRPAPDITGAIQHSMAALECVAREVCGDEKATLGDIMKRYRDLIPRPLDEAVSKTWGYASENARHIREGREPTFEEAELVVGVSSAIATYLARKKE